MQTLVVLSHPNLAVSRVNKAMLQIANEDSAITVTNLYDKYSDFKINIETEQELLSTHNRIVFQFPFYWYSCPPLMKQYIDSVLSYNWAFGEKFALQDKELIIAITAGGTAENYQQGGKNDFTISELLRPFEQTAKFVKMKYLSPFVTYGVYGLSNEEIQNISTKYVEYIKAR